MGVSLRREGEFKTWPDIQIHYAGYVAERETSCFLRETGVTLKSVLLRGESILLDSTGRAAASFLITAYS